MYIYLTHSECPLLCHKLHSLIWAKKPNYTFSSPDPPLLTDFVCETRNLASAVCHWNEVDSHLYGRRATKYSINERYHISAIPAFEEILTKNMGGKCADL